MYRIYDKDGYAYADLVTLVKNDSDKEKLLNYEELVIRDEKYEFKSSLLKKNQYTFIKLTREYIKNGEINKNMHEELLDILKSQKYYLDSLGKIINREKEIGKSS